MADPKTVLPLCPRTCGICSAVCYDRDEACQEWAAAGRCSEKGMLKQCPQASHPGGSSPPHSLDIASPSLVTAHVGLQSCSICNELESFKKGIPRGDIQYDEL